MLNSIISGAKKKKGAVSFKKTLKTSTYIYIIYTNQGDKMSKDKEVKKITAGFIFSWIFGIMFMLMGMGTIGAGSAVAGIVIILCSAMIIPFFNKLIAEKMHVEISGGVKFLLVIVIFVAMGFSMANTTNDIYQSNQVDQAQVDTTTGEDTTVQENNVQPVESKPALNKKTEYIKNSIKLEDVEVGEGYGQFDVAGYDKKKPTVQGKVRNTGNQILERVEITVYFLDSTRTRIGEKEYTPISSYSIMGDDTPLKPNYVRDWGYVVSDAPDGWDKKVEVVITDITFGED